MRTFTLAASSIALGLALGCGSGSEGARTSGTGGAGEETGGAPGAGGAPQHTGGAPGATGGAAGGDTGGASGGASVTPDAGAAGGSGTLDAASPGGSGGQGGGGQGGGAGTPDGGTAADTWEGFAKAFFVTYCASCHNDDKKGDSSRDYHVMANVMKEKVEIACGVSKSQADWSKRGCSGFPPARQFPVGGGPKPTDAERYRLLRWIDSGTP